MSRGCDRGASSKKLGCRRPVNLIAAISYTGADAGRVQDFMRRLGQRAKAPPPTVLTDIITVSDIGLVNLHDEDHIR